MKSLLSNHLGVVVAMAVPLFGALQLPAAEVIVDNSDSAYSELSGSWSSSTATGVYGANARRVTTATTASAVAQWQPTIPSAGDYQVFVWYPAGSSRVSDVHYVVYYNGGSQAVTVNQTTNAGKWVSIGTFNFAAGSSSNGRVTMTNQSSTSGKKAYADAVRFLMPEPVSLTMAVSPAGTGTTTPAAGSTYSYNSGDVVSISASPADGYVFDHWTVSTGAEAASPKAASTTVTMDVSKTVTAVFTVPTPQLRAFWADAFHEGFKSKTEIDNMVARAVAGNYNAIVAETLAYHDNSGGGHGAYWKSSIVPAATDITTTDLPNGDPLAYLVQQAHAYGIEVHCWMVAFRVSAAWPPSGNSYLTGHSDYLTVPLASMGSGAATVGSYYVFDPGSPDVQDYLMTIVRELVTNYEIDGINWDYIRYTQTNAGYPASSAYEYSGLKRFQRIYGRTDTPAATGDTQWNDFRRQTITEVVRRTRAEMAAVTSNPRQPLRFTCDLITTGNVTSTNFASSPPYNNYLSNWGFWLAQGYLDGGMPMCYDREYDSSQATWFRNWVNACVGWKGQRHMYIGQANYLNTMAGSVTQMQYAHDAGAEGTVNYSYASTVDANMDGATEIDWTWYTYVGANLFTWPSATPPMPWRDPATATEGTLWGRVTKGGVAVDNATVQVGSLSTVQTDGAGYYVVTLIPATTGSFTAYSVNATDGTDSATHAGVQVFAGETRREDISLDGCTTPPTIMSEQQPQAQSACPGGTATFTVTATSCSGTPSYQWQKDGSNLSEAGHYAGVTTTTLTVSNADSNDVGQYRCVVTDTVGTTNSDAAALSLKAATTVTQQPSTQAVCPGGSVQFTVAGTGDGTLTYVWQKNGTNLAEGGHYAGVTTTTLTISTADSNDAAEYRCVVTGGCGSETSNAATLTVNTLIAADFDKNCAVDASDLDIFQACGTGAGIGYDPAGLPTGCTLTPDGNGKIAADFDLDGDVDQTDFGVFQRCLSGTGTAPDPTCGQ
jgi:uncharacterized lipoprotein YddW (UPF0748 family)